MRWAVGLAILAAALLLAGCPPANELRTSGQAGEFIADVAHGSDVGEWTLKDDAVVLAERAWLDRSTIERLGTTLGEHGGEWACTAADQADTARDLLNQVESTQAEVKRLGIVLDAEGRGADHAEVEALIGDVLRLTPFEALKTLDALCTL